MLHSESLEQPSPLWRSQVSWSERLQKWMEAGSTSKLEPRLDVAVSVGGETVTVVAGKKCTSFPAMLAVDVQGKVTALGEEAAELEGREPEGIQVIRPIRGGVIYDPKGALLLLKAALKKRFLLSGAPNLLLAVSAQTAALDTRSWLELGRQAGGHETYLVSQLLAAALGAGRSILDPRAQMVLHFGAGGCEAGVVSLGSCLEVQRSRIGGELLTSSLQEYIRHKYGLVTHRRSIDKLKFLLDVRKGNQAEKATNLWGRRVEDGQPSCMSIDMVDLADHLFPLVEQWCSWVQQFISELPVEWLEDLRSGGILLTGGSAGLIGLSELLSERLGLRVEVAEESASACSRGLSQILMRGEVRHALLAPREAQLNADDYRARRVFSESGLGRKVAVAALVAASCGLALQGKMSGQTLGTALSSVTAPVLGSTDTVIEQVQTYGNPKAATDKLARNQKLFAAQNQRDVAALEEENRRLWGWLGFREVGPQSRWLKQQPILAQVVGRDPRGWLSRWTLNVGSQEGINVGQIVVAQEGLVGKVVSVAAHSCVVRPFVDSESIVSGIVKGRSTTGVVLGQSQPQLEMRYLDPNSGVKSGDRVITNGQDGQLPAGIEVGIIRRVQNSADSSFLQATVMPSVNLSTISEVLVLRDGPGHAPAKLETPKTRRNNSVGPNLGRNPDAVSWSGGSQR